MAIIAFISNEHAVRMELEKHLKKAAIKLGAAAETNAKKEIKRAVYDTPPSPNYVRTGRLRNSLTHDYADNYHTILVGSAVEYAPYVELGTYKMAARPYLRPALENHQAEYKQILEDEFSS